MPIYLKFGNIKGDVKEKAHRGWIELISCQFVTTPSGGKRGGGSTSPEIAITKKADNASVALFRYALSGEGVEAVIDWVREKEPGVYIRYKLSNTLISSSRVSGHGDDPTESFTLNFTTIGIESNPGTPPP